MPTKFHVRERDVTCPCYYDYRKSHQKCEHSRVRWAGQAGAVQLEKKTGYRKLRRDQAYGSMTVAVTHQKELE